MNNYNGAYGEYYRCYGLNYMNGYAKQLENENAVTPAMLKKYYGYNVHGGGEGITVGIVVAYGNSTVERDAAIFSNAFSIPPVNVNVISHPPSFKGAISVKAWSIETSVDVQWVHAFAPKAAIVCYFAASDDFYELFCMIKKADEQCDIVLLSFGKSEFAGQTEYADFFANSHALYVCACGNSGKTAFPATARNVVAVGGTKIYFDSFGDALGKELPWERTGGGASVYCDIPDYQKAFGKINELTFGKRAVPDISFFAYGSGGAAVFNSEKGWITAKGTSVSAACITGICAVIAQKDKKLLKKKASYFYELAAENPYESRKKAFNDIPCGNSAGFDLCTGLGSPNISSIMRMI